MNKTGTQTIHTRRLILRRFRVEDAGDMFRNWASDPEVTRFLTWPMHASEDVSRAVLNDWVPRYADGGYFNWAIELKESGAVIGNIAVVKLNEAAEAADMGYCLSRAFWGRGIMPEALRAAEDYLFDTVGLGRVGILRGAGKNNLGVCDEAWYAMVKRDRQDAPRRKEAAPVAVRFAREEELDRINELRKQVNDLHVAGKPEVFKPGFRGELRDYIREIWRDPAKKIAVAERDGTVVGFAVLNHITRPENPFMFERDYLDVDEFGVDEGFRRQGVASAMVRFILDHAREKGFGRLELNMWEFNRGALAFYETAGFTTYRRYMEMRL